MLTRCPTAPSAQGGDPLRLGRRGAFVHKSEESRPAKLLVSLLFFNFANHVPAASYAAGDLQTGLYIGWLCFRRSVCCCII